MSCETKRYAEAIAPVVRRECREASSFDALRDVMRLTDEVGSPYTDEVILRGHDWTEDEACEAVTNWLLDEGVCDDEAEAAEWWAGLAWLDYRETHARKIPYRDGGPRSWTLHYPQDRGPGAFPVTIVEHRATVRRRLHDAARRQRIEDAARAEWPDADIYMTSGYAGGYLHADVGPVRVRVTWQEGGATAAPVCYLRADVPDVTRQRIQRAVARIHAAALAHQTTHPSRRARALGSVQPARCPRRRLTPDTAPGGRPNH